MPAGFPLTSGADGRAAARARPDALPPGGAAVPGRGCLSSVMLRAMTARGPRPAFRIQRSSAAASGRFRDGDRDGARVRAAPGKDALRRLKAAGIPAPDSPAVLRPVRCGIGRSRHAPATALAGPERCGVNGLAALRHGRRGTEGTHRVSKDAVAADAFRGRSGRGVRREPCARSSLTAMTRLFTDSGDGVPDGAHDGGPPKMRADSSSAPATPAGSPGETIPGQAAAPAGAVSRVAGPVPAVRARPRPGRPFPRRSEKPVGKRGRSRRQAAQPHAGPEPKRAKPPRNRRATLRK